MSTDEEEVRPNRSTPSSRQPMGVWSVAALGIGAMVGAGIFALLGQAAQMVGRDVYLAFAIGGVIALLSGYSYARLAARFPTSDGIVDYFDRGFPSRTVTGGFTLLYLVTQVVAAAMIAKTFGAYADRLLVGDTSVPFVANLLGSAIVILLVVVSMIGAHAVGRMERLLVAAKLIILAALLLAAAPGIDVGKLGSGRTVGPTTLFAGIGLTFFAYAGYGMMTNASGHVANPPRDIPRAIYLAIGIVIVLYVGLAIVVLGNLSAAELARYASTAVAQAAVPVLGSAGFVILAVCALFSTASGITACLFCVVEVSRALVARKQLPAFLGQPAWRQGTTGLFWAAAVILVLVNLVDLSAIARVASATFLICYLGVFLVHWRLFDQVGGSRLLIGLGTVLMSAVLVAFARHLWSGHPLAIGLIVIAVLGSVGLQWLIQKAGRRYP